MDRVIMSYYTSSLLLTTVGTLLSMQSPPFYAEIVILFAALLFAIVGAFKAEKAK